MSYRSPWGTNSWWWPSPWWYGTPRPTPTPEPQPEPLATPEPEPTVKEPIKIVTFAVLKETNEKANNTRMYETTKVVLRRGNDFRVKFTLSRAYDKTTDALNVEFKRGNNADFRSGSRFECLIDRRAVRDWEWKGYVADTSGSEVEAVVRIPVDAPIGEYQVVAEAVDLKTSRENTMVAPQPAVILFNPWDKDDGVYLEDDRARQEYVLNGSGKIWAGSSNNSFTWPWEFEQFESYSLDSALYLLDQYSLDSQLRRSPVFVSRTCATMVNANDNDGGILYGNWSGNYSGGVSPSAWSGSGAILEQYWRTKRAVKWAQCWVFGGTLTSVLRALGIPARPITNFASAHDTDANRSIDFYLDANLNTIDRLTADSIWNYHVWVEAWMERPDLRGAYGGWQAVDATPQEPSPDTPGNVFTLGPAPVSAVKEGQNYKYDSEFVISEVNADVKYYRYYYGSSPQLLLSRTSDVGKNISTKSILSTEREDITASYKHPEGSVAERVAVEGTESKVAKSDVDIDIITAKDVMIGEDLRAKVEFRSSASLSRGVKYTIQVRPVSYIGAQGEILKKITGDIAVGPNGVEEIPIIVTPNEYVGKVSEQLLVDITVFASISETDTNIIEKETFRFRTPDLTLDVAGEVRVGKETSVTASFKNPLNVWLTNVEWFVEGAGLTKPLTINGRYVRAGGTASTTFSISPRNAVEPTRTLTVTFESKQLEGIMGTTVVEVKS